MKPSAILLADGMVIPAESIGYDSITIGEIVFNTSMTGYQEIITDPSYDKQIVTFTNPHIGNTGVNVDDYESSYNQELLSEITLQKKVVGETKIIFLNFSRTK